MVMPRMPQWRGVRLSFMVVAVSAMGARFLRGPGGSKAQAALLQQRQHRLGEILQPRRIVVEAQLHAVETGQMQLLYGVGDVVRIADDLEMAAHDPGCRDMALPALRVAAGM